VNRFETHPRLTLLGLALLLTLATDVTFTRMFRALVPPKPEAPSYRARSAAYHHGLQPMARVDDARWGPLVYPYRTNSLGFRDRDTRVVPLQSKGRRLVFMGDSFTEGVGVPYDETFVGRIDAALAPNGIEVLNAGVELYSPAIYWRKTKALLDEGLRFNEMAVFVDISDVQDEVAYRVDEDGDVALDGRRRGREEKLNGRYDNRLWPLRKLERFLDDHTLVTAGLFRLFERPFASDHHRAAAWTTDPVVLEEYGREGLPLARTHMDALAELLKAHRIRLIIAVYPWTDQLLLGDRDSLQVRYWHEWAASSGADFVDLFPAFFDRGAPRDTVRRLFIAGDIHWNEAGHRLVADAFLKWYRSR
jgi:lysophospholipase L1-like esterase